MSNFYFFINYNNAIHVQVSKQSMQYMYMQGSTQLQIHYSSIPYDLIVIFITAVILTSIIRKKLSLYSLIFIFFNLILFYYQGRQELGDRFKQHMHASKQPQEVWNLIQIFFMKWKKKNIRKQSMKKPVTQCTLKNCLSLKTEQTIALLREVNNGALDFDVFKKKCQELLP